MARRISIPDEIIEIAKEHPDKKLEIYWATLLYLIDWEIKYNWMMKYLDKKQRISDKMKGNQNRCGTSEKTDMAELKNSSGRTEKNSCGTTEKPSRKARKLHKDEQSLTIYIDNNKELYDIVYSYIQSNINTWNISYLINKHWELNYIYSQMLEAQKIIKQVWLETFITILAFIKQDEFWGKQILSIAKLNRKDKDGVPYYIVIMDKIKNYHNKNLIPSF